MIFRVKLGGMEVENDFTPAYYQIKRNIRAKIASGNLKKGDVLPGRNSLVAEYECSWGTLNRAINELILEGVLVAERGKGTYVSSSHVSEDSGKSLAPIKVWLCHPFPSVYISLVEMMEGMREVAVERGRPIEFLDSVTSRAEPTDLTGYIVVTPSNRQFKQLQRAWDRGERFVVLNSDFEDAHFSTINADIYGSTRAATEHLIQHGHRRIGLMGIRYGFSNYERRIVACRDALHEVGAPFHSEWIVERLESHHETKKLFREWLETHPECTAIFAADYTSALILMEIVQEKQIRIPEDLSLFASGEAPSASMLKVALSTVVQPFLELGKRAVSRLVDERWDLGTELLSSRLMIRESVAERIKKR